MDFLSLLPKRILPLFTDKAKACITTKTNEEMAKDTRCLGIDGMLRMRQEHALTMRSSTSPGRLRSLSLPVHYTSHAIGTVTCVSFLPNQPPDPANQRLSRAGFARRGSHRENIFFRYGARGQRGNPSPRQAPTAS